MNSENIKNVTNQAIEQLIAALNAGKSGALTNYLAAVARFHLSLAKTLTDRSK
jgi:hypothetical protein